MYHKVRITVVSLVVMAICMLSSVTTLAYFTDTDSTTNNFVVGSVSTELKIYDDITGSEKHILDASEYVPADGYVYKDSVELSEMPFYLQATNTGNIPVYQRFRVVIPIALAGAITLDLPTMTDNCVVETVANHTCSNADYTVIYNSSVEVGNEPTYAEYYIISENKLAVGDTTQEWPTLGIRFGDISGKTNLLTCSESSSSGDCTLGIRTYSDAIQTAGFANAVSAFGSLGETY